MALRDDIQRAVSGYPVAVNPGNYQDGSDPNDPTHNALTAATIGQPQLGNAHFVGGMYRFRSVTIAVSLNANTSWVRRAYWNAASADQRRALTTHEQGHMDIAFLVAWNLARSLLQLQVAANDVQLGRRTPHQANTLLRGQANSWIVNNDILAGRLQTTYDVETDHGRRGPAQTNWTAMLARWVAAFRTGPLNPPALEELIRGDSVQLRDG